MGWGGGGARLAPNFALLCFVSCCARCGGLRVIPLLACSDFPKIQQGFVSISERVSMDSVAQWLRRWSDPNIGCLRQLVGQHQLIQVRVLAESSNTWARGMAGTIMHRQLQSKEGPKWSQRSQLTFCILGAVAQFAPRPLLTKGVDFAFITH